MKKLCKPALAVFLSVIFILCGTGISAITVDGYREKYNSFISDVRFQNGAYWPQRAPYIASNNYRGCMAYCADYAQYVFGVRDIGVNHSNPSEIQSGDIIKGTWSSGGTHWLVVLEVYPNGSLMTAEGAAGGKSFDRVRVGTGIYSGKGNTLTEKDGSVLKIDFVIHFPVVVHEHSYSGKVTIEALCCSSGIKTYTCSCGNSYTENIPASGHTWDEGVITTPPKCTENGTKTYTCTKCPEIKTETVEHTGHSFEEKTVSAALFRSSYTQFRCSACGENYIEKGNERAKWPILLAVLSGIGIGFTFLIIFANKRRSGNIFKK